MKLTRLEMVVLAVAMVSFLWPFGESYYTDLTVKPKTAFYQNLILWSVTANMVFIFSGLAFLLFCGLLRQRFKREQSKMPLWLKLGLALCVILSLSLIYLSVSELHETFVLVRNQNNY